MVDLLAGSPEVNDLDAVLAAVEAREKVLTTAVGEGLAIPHARTECVSHTIAAFANTAEPVEFGALDEKPVRLVFLLVGPESDNGKHVRYLSRASLLFCRSSLRASLLEAGSGEELRRLIEKAETELHSG